MPNEAVHAGRDSRRCRISPEQLVCEYIEQLILYPGALAGARLRRRPCPARRRRSRSKGGLLVGQKRIATLKEHIPNTEGRIAAIYRNGKAMLPDGDTVIQEGDEVFFIAAARTFACS